MVVHRVTRGWRSSSLDSVALETRFCPIGTAIPVSRSSHPLRMSEFHSVFIPSIGEKGNERRGGRRSRRALDTTDLFSSYLPYSIRDYSVFASECSFSAEYSDAVFPLGLRLRHEIAAGKRIRLTPSRRRRDIRLWSCFCSRIVGGFS